MTVHYARKISGDLILCGNLYPDADNTRDIGKTGKEFKDIYIDGEGKIDALEDGVLLGGDAISKIKTGQYTGDGAVSQAITGIGFQPKIVMIWVHETGSAFSSIHVRMDQMHANMSAMHMEIDGATDHPHGISDDHIISLDADGFTVDDNSADADPNTNGITYDYLALG